ncbi:hypothetical protein Gotur_000729 [Gossypium turneri]
MWLCRIGNFSDFPLIIAGLGDLLRINLLFYFYLTTIILNS